MTLSSTSILQRLYRRRLNIKMRLYTEHLTIIQRLNLERELWRLENQINAISSDDSTIELRGQSLRT